jgi:hypothetical protein
MQRQAELELAPYQCLLLLAEVFVSLSCVQSWKNQSDPLSSRMSNMHSLSFPQLAGAQAVHTLLSKESF